MRLIDADALIKNICTEQCGKRREDCDARCEYVTFIDNAPTIDSVPIKPLARWLAGYAMPPINGRVGKPETDYFGIRAGVWEEFLRGMDWEGPVDD